MVAKGAYEKYGGVNKSTIFGGGLSGIGGLLNKGDGSGTDRSTYAPLPHPNPLGTGASGAIREEKYFTSPGGTSTHGAVSALNLAGAGLIGGGGASSANNTNNTSSLG